MSALRLVWPRHKQHSNNAQLWCFTTQNCVSYHQQRRQELEPAFPVHKDNRSLMKSKSECANESEEELCLTDHHQTNEGHLRWTDDFLNT
jgi:hypothetical protein